ncbi:MAG: hypothetical protein J3Q66DRAFT_375996 [Benniella sp.]|nr:MAG: hypothetical protein J3Q66DRAFT_375996 [Benniella sp.]
MAYRDGSKQSGSIFKPSFKETGTWIDTRSFAIMLRLAIKRMTGLFQQMDQLGIDHRRVRTHRDVLERLRLAVLQALKSPPTQETIKTMPNVVVKKLVVIMMDGLMEHCTDADQPEKPGS